MVRLKALQLNAQVLRYRLQILLPLISGEIVINSLEFPKHYKGNLEMILYANVYARFVYLSTIPSY